MCRRRQPGSPPRTRSLAALQLRLTLLLLFSVTACRGTSPAEATPPPASQEPATPGEGPVSPADGALSAPWKSAVIVHSWTGRTAAAGRSLASMFGSEFALTTSPPPEMGGPTNALQRAASLDGVEILFLGSPIWGHAPSARIVEWVRGQDLSGIRVVPFFTYLHFADPDAIDGLREAIGESGGTPLDPILLRVPIEVDAGWLRAEIRAQVAARTDIWQNAEEHEECEDTTAGLICLIPAGNAWVAEPTTDTCAFEERLVPQLTLVSAFAIDQGEVTSGAYEACVAANSCETSRTDSDIVDDLRSPELPVAGVNAAQAQAFCEWRGGHLPNAAQWTRAARGDEMSPFPWGDSTDLSARGNFGERPGNGHTFYELGDLSWEGDGFPGLAPACAFPAGTSPFGVCDMAGNLSEFVWPQEPGEFVWLKGSSWLEVEGAAFAVEGGGCLPVELGFYAAGFRCVYPR